MNSTERREREFSIYFRNAKEKQDAKEWAELQGHDSLNGYFLYLFRQDKKVNGGERLAALQTIKNVAMENRIRSAETEAGQRR